MAVMDIVQWQPLVAINLLVQKIYAGIGGMYHWTSQATRTNMPCLLLELIARQL